MMQGTTKVGAAGVAVNESTHAVNTPFNTGGSGGLLSQQKDSKESATAPRFGDVFKEIQAKYGQRPEKPREAKKSLGKDDFLRIMLTQMKNQDPTNPFKAEQMATEVAQFTNVEQLQNVNQNLTKMATQNRPLEQMSMTNMIGKMVTIDRQRFPHFEGQNDDLSFVLSRNAGSVSVAVENDAGEVVFQKDLGAQKAGVASFVWDGLKTNTLPAKAGSYRLRVEAKDESGRAIEINPQVHARVIGVSFEGTEPVFLVGDARHQDKVTMKNIVRIEMDSNSPPSEKGSSNAKPSSPPEPVKASPSSLITFQRGVGSNTVPMSPDLAKNFDKLQDSEKGFPNGLRDPDEPMPQQNPPPKVETTRSGGPQVQNQETSERGLHPQVAKEGVNR